MSATLELAGVDKLSGVVSEIRSQLKGLSDEAQSGSNILTSAFGLVEKAALGVGAAVAGVGAASLYAANQFQETMSRIEGLAGGAHAEVEGMKQEILSMGEKLPQTANELGQALYFIESSGIRGGAGLDVLDASAKAAAAGLGSTVVVADAVTSTLNAYKMTADQSSHVTDVLTKAVLEGKSEASAFAGSIGRVLPIASLLGVSFEQVTASMATMTRVGLNADEAATALRGTLAALAAPGKQARDTLASIGLSAAELRQSIADKGLLATLQMLMDKTGGNIELLKAIIPNIRALTGVLATAGSQGDEYAKVLDSIEHAAGATDHAFQVASQNVNFQLATLRNQFINAGISIGTAFEPGISKLLAALSSGLGGALEAVKAWANQVGPVFAKAIDGIVAGFKGAGLQGATSGLLYALGVNPETIVKITTYVGQIQSAFGGLVSAVQSGYARLKEAASQGWSAFQSGGAGEGASTFLKALGLDSSAADRVKSAIDGIISAVRDGMSRLAQAVNLDAVGNGILTLANIVSQHSGAIVAGIGAITAAFIAFQAGSLIMSAVTGLATALMLLTTPIGLIAAIAGVAAAGLTLLGIASVAVALDIGGMNEKITEQSSILGIFISLIQLSNEHIGKIASSIGPTIELFAMLGAGIQHVSDTLAGWLNRTSETIASNLNLAGAFLQTSGAASGFGETVTQNTPSINLAKEAVEALKTALWHFIDPVGSAIVAFGNLGESAKKFATDMGWIHPQAQEMGQSLQRAAEQGDRYWDQSVKAADTGMLGILKAFASGKITMTEAMREIMDSVHKASVDGFNKILSSAASAAAQYANILKTMSFNAELAGGALQDATKSENRADLKSLASPITPSEWNTIQGALTQQKADADKAAAAAKAASEASRGFGGALGNLGDSGMEAAGKAKGAKKSAEEMAKEAAETLKTIVESITKMKEFLDKGYGALVSGDGAAKIQALSEQLFEMGRVFAEQLIGATSDLDIKLEQVGKSIVDMTDKGATAIQHAASALNAMVGLLPKMWEFRDTEAYSALVNSPQIYVEMGQHLIDMGVVFYNQMSAAAAGIEESTVKATDLLAQGIQHSAQAISSVIGALKGMWEFYSSGMYDEVMANKALVMHIAQTLIAFGKDLFLMFGAAAVGVKEETVKAAGLLAQGIQSATSAISSTLKLVQDILQAAFDPSFIDAVFGRTRSLIMRIASALISLGKSIFEQFAAAGAGVAQKSVEAAKRLSEGVVATANGLKAALDSLKVLEEVMNTGGMTTEIGLWQPGNKIHAWVLAIAHYLAIFARDITEQWAAAGMSLGSQVVAAAKRLSDGVKATADGLKSALDSLKVLEEVANTGGMVEDIGLWKPGNKYHAWLLAISAAMAAMARTLTEQWGAVGAQLGSQAVVGARRLADGIKATSDGIAGVRDAYRGLIDITALLTTLYYSNITIQSLIGLSDWSAHIAHLLTGEWAHMGQALTTGAVSGAQALASGIEAVSKGIGSITSAFRGLIDLQGVVNQLWNEFQKNERDDGGWVALSGWAAHISHLLIGEWAHMGQALAAGAVEGAKALSDGIAAVSSGIASMTSALDGLIQAGQTVNRYASQFTTLSQIIGGSGLLSYLGNVGLIFANEWGRLGAALNTGAVAGAKALTEGVSAVSSGVSGMTSVLNGLLEAGLAVGRFGSQFASMTQLVGGAGLLSYLGNVGLILANEWGRLGNALNTGAVAGAKALTEGINAVAGGLSGMVSVMQTLTSNLMLVGRFQTAFPSITWLVGLTSWYANISLLITNEWGRVGGALSTGAVSGAKALSDGIEAVSRGVSALVQVMGLFLSSVNGLLRFAVAFPTGEAVKYITDRYAWVAEVMASEWGAIGQRLSAEAVAGDGALASGVDAVAKGVGSLLEAMRAFAQNSATLNLFARDFPTQQAVEAIVDRYAWVAEVMTERWGEVGQHLKEGAVAGAKALSEGIGAVATGIKSVLDVSALLTKPPQLPDLGMPNEPGSLDAYVDGLVKWALALIKRVNATVGTVLPQVSDGMKALAEGIGVALSIIKDTLDASKLLTKPPDLPDLGMPGDPGSLDTWVGLLVDWAIQVTKRVSTTAAHVAGLTESQKNLQDRIGSSLSIIKDTLDAAKALTDPPGLPPLGANENTGLHHYIILLTEWSMAVTKDISDTALSVPALSESMKNLQDRIGSGLSIIKDTLDAVKALTDPPGLPPLGMDQNQGLHHYIRLLILWAREVSQDAQDAANNDGGVSALSENMKNLQDKIGSAVSIFKDAVEAIKTLTDPPNLPVLGSTRIRGGGKGSRGLGAYIHDLVVWAKEVGDEAQRAAGDVGALSEGMKNLQDKIGASLSIIKDALDVIKALTKPPEIPELGDLSDPASIRTFIHNLVIWAKEVANEAQAAAGTDIGVLSESMKALQDRIGSTLSIVKDTLDLFKSINGYKGDIEAPPSAADAPNDPLIKTVGYLALWARTLSETVVDTLSKTYLTEVPAQVKAVVDAVSSSLSVVKDVLDTFTTILSYKGTIPDPPTEGGFITGNSYTIVDALDKLSRWAVYIGEAFVLIASNTTLISVPDSAKAVQEALSAATSSIKDVLDTFKAIAENKADIPEPPANGQAPDPATSGLLGSLDRLLRWGKWMGEQFASISSNTTLSEDQAKVISTVAGAVGSAAGAVKDALDTIQALDKNTADIPDVPASGSNNGLSLAINKLMAWAKWMAEQFALTVSNVSISDDIAKSAASVADMVGKAASSIKDALDTIRTVLEFSWTEKTGVKDFPDIVHTGIPTVASTSSIVKAAIDQAVAIMKQFEDAAKDPALQSYLTKASQDAVTALSTLTTKATDAIKSVLGVLKDLLEFRIENGPGWIQEQGGNNIWSTGSSTPGIPTADAVRTKVDQLVEALKSIVDGIKAGINGIDLGGDAADLQRRIAAILGIVESAAALIKAVHDLVGTTGNGKLNLDIHIAVAFDIPDLAEDLAKIAVPTIHIPIVWDVPPLPDGSSIGGSGGAGTLDTPTKASGGQMPPIKINVANPSGIGTSVASLKNFYGVA